MNFRFSLGSSRKTRYVSAGFLHVDSQDNLFWQHKKWCVWRIKMVKRKTLFLLLKYCVSKMGNQYISRCASFSAYETLVARGELAKNIPLQKFSRNEAFARFRESLLFPFCFLLHRVKVPVCIVRWSDRIQAGKLFFQKIPKKKYGPQQIPKNFKTRCNCHAKSYLSSERALCVRCYRDLILFANFPATHRTPQNRTFCRKCELICKAEPFPIIQNRFALVFHEMLCGI